MYRCLHSYLVKDAPWQRVQMGRRIVLIHQYKNNGYNIVMDVNSGAVHVVDEVTYDVIAMFEDKTEEQIIEALESKYADTEIAEAIEEVKALKEDGQLLQRTYTKSI